MHVFVASLLLNLISIERGRWYSSNDIYSIGRNENAGVKTTKICANDQFVYEILDYKFQASIANRSQQCTLLENSMAHQCELCDRSFETERGLNRHLNHCRRQRIAEIPQPPAEFRELDDGIGLDGFVNEPYLPDFQEVDIIPTRPCNNIDGQVFASSIVDIYNECVKWRKNLFKLPSGGAAKEFVKEMSHWLEQFNRTTDFQGIALKVYMVLPSLLLQKPGPKSKAKEHLAILSHRLELWKKGELSELLRDCRQIQAKLKSSKRRNPDDTARIFARLVFDGKISAALKFISDEADSGILELNEETLGGLAEKHPEPSPVLEHSLLFGPINKASTHELDAIDEQSILKAAQLTRGSSGPSFLDADQYRHILCSRKYKHEGKELRMQMAAFAKRLATEIIDPAMLESYVACRLIPLNKNPGIRPIGVGEVMRRIVGKTIGSVLKDDIQEAAGPLQVSTGLKGGAEAAIHSMREIFSEEGCDGVILVDASNAFNRLNRSVALHNIQITAPSFAPVLINTYRVPSRLFVTGGGEMVSQEGTTQGDPLAMAFYGLSTVPLQNDLRIGEPEVKQVWLADDATGAGKLRKLRGWWDIIIEHGKRYGYYVNEDKSWLILSDPDMLEFASELFAGTGIKITTAGKRHLGAALGNVDFRKEYVSEKVDEWSREVVKLAEFARSQPHAAYAAFIHGEQHRFRFCMRTIPGMDEYLKPLDDVINEKLIPAIVGREINDTERILFSLPVREGGLGISILADEAPQEFISSITINAPLAAIIALQGSELPDEPYCRQIAQDERHRRTVEHRSKIDLIDESLHVDVLRAVHQAREPGASSWLSARPSEEHGFKLNKSEFRDAISIRYNSQMKGLPSFCVCGKPFDINHALNCKCGGFVTIRHNDVRDFEAALLSKVCKDVETEPILQPVTGEVLPKTDAAGDEARPDVRARGFWRRGQNAYFDVAVTNAGAVSYAGKPLKSVLAKFERAKKSKYNHRVMNIEHGTFTPLIFTANGCMGPECSMFHKSIADKISEKTGEAYSDVISFIRCKLSFILMRSAILCARGSRRPKNSDNLATIGDDFGLYAKVLNIRE